MRKIVKIVTFYDDGTFTESVPSAPHSPMPSTPFSPVPHTPWPPEKYETMKKCPKCGIELKGIMGYVCNNYPCPCGMGGTWCSDAIK